MEPTDSDVTSWTASRIAGLVRSREVSSEVVVRAHLDRIRTLDREIGAFQIVRGEQALNEARQLSERSDLADLPLAGVPVAIKDNIDVAGEATRHGSAATVSRPATEDDVLVRRLRAAGCIVIGKTKMPELAIWPFTESEAFGITRNPWNTDRTPGGSTGGGGAAVAARMAALALGSDGGGSIRIPAACCGIAGLKPGPGLVPLAGGLAEHWLGLTEFGPLARTAEDLALMFDVLSGVTRHRHLKQPVSPLRIAVSVKPPIVGARVNADVKRAVETLADALATAGHKVCKADPPYPLNIGLRFMRCWLLGIAQEAEGLASEQLELRTRAMVRAGKWLRRRGWHRPAAEDDFGVSMRNWFSNYDVLLTPTLTEPAVPIGKWREKGWITTALGCGKWLLTSPWNLARFPAASIPAGLSADNLPIGMQLVAMPGAEQTLLALIAQAEAIKPWPQWVKSPDRP